MSTKNNPGAFRCYEAALPDEHIFTILARDPAGPATLRFWADERERLGKTENPDDIDRIDDARRDAELMEEWRAANLDPVGTGPTWHGVTVNDELGGPIRVQPDNTVYIYAERVGEAAVRLSIDWLRSRTRDLVEGRMTREFFGDLIDHACKSPDRRRERVVPVEEAAFDAAKRDARTLTMMNAINKALSMLDDLGAIPDYALSINAIRETLFNGLADAPVWGTVRSKFGFSAEELRLKYIEVQKVCGDAEARFLIEQMGHHKLATLIADYENWQEYWDAAEAKLASTKGLTPGEQVVVDSQPTNLAHAPEVPPHRFSVFHKGEKYAYARGLEINPMHLPTALDAMEKDGWSLVAIFGQTDSQHVGFIFRQNNPPVAKQECEEFVIEWATRLRDGSGCCITRAAASEWPEWAQPCFDRGRSMMP